MAGYRTIAVTVSTAVFMQFLDASALNTALPAMGRDFAVPAVRLNVTILAYQIAMAAFIPLGSTVASRIGARNTFALALLLFMLGSLSCAFSPSLPALIASRALQGLGGAAMMPVSRQLVVRSARPDELVNAMNWLLIPGIVGPLLGPVVGGLIVTYASWHWIFLVNVPVALIGIAMTLALVPDDTVRISDPIDFRGLALVAATMVCLIFGLEGFSRPGGAPMSAGLVLLGIGGCLAFIRHARGNPSAALDLSLLKIESFRESTIAGALLRTTVSALGLVLPLWFQLAMGKTAAQAGLLIVASTFGALSSRFLSDWLMRHAHPRTIANCSAIALTVALTFVARLDSRLPPYLFVLVLFFQGLSSATAFVVLNAVSYVDVERERIGAATGLYTTFQQLTFSLGVTAGVWAIAAMEWLTGSGPADSRTYSGSLTMLAGLALLSLVGIRRIGDRSLEALRRRAPAD